MDRKKKTWMAAGLQIVSALVWAAVIIGCSYVLEGTGYHEEIFQILIAAASTHFLLLAGMSAELFTEDKDGQSKRWWLRW